MMLTFSPVTIVGADALLLAMVELRRLPKKGVLWKALAVEKASNAIVHRDKLAFTGIGTIASTAWFACSRAQRVSST
jgi:hypothetical protein